jgi:tetratricopeptide (TPR) repeat protein
MAIIHRSFRQKESAIEDLRESLRRGASGPMRLSPDVRQDTLLDLAQLQVELSQHEEAMETLKEVSDTADSLALLAESQFALGNLDAARNCLAQGLAIDPDHVETLLVQGRIAMEAKDISLAVESFDRASKLRPQSSALQTLLSQALHASGQDDLAKQHARKASQLSELNQEYADLRSSSVLEPRNALTCFRLGLMAERLGLEQEAAGWYRAVILLDPRHADARSHLAMLSGGLNHRDGRQP